MVVARSPGVVDAGAGAGEATMAAVVEVVDEVEGTTAHPTMVVQARIPIGEASAVSNQQTRFPRCCVSCSSFSDLVAATE